VTLDLAKLLPPTLAPVAQALLHKTARGQEPLRSDLLTMQLPDGSTERLRLVARSVSLDHGEPHLLLSFEPDVVAPVGETAAPASSDIETMNMDQEHVERLQTLERELAATRESLQATIEELETANEELQATNEELMASNEELQSSNEELQSVNEELYTVNAENQEKIEILNRLNADLDNMAKAAAIATIFVDANLLLTRFTPEATTLFKIRDGDLGRSIEDFTNLLDYPDFVEELKRTIAEGKMSQREIRVANGRLYLLRVLPYAVREREARGAVATFVDVTLLRDAERLQAVLDSLPEHVALLNDDGEVKMINRAWREFANSHNASGGPGGHYPDAWAGGRGFAAEQDAMLRAGLNELIAGGRDDFAMVYPYHGADGERWFAMHAAPIVHGNGGIVVSHVDISPWYRDAGG
jgi:two-component system, chemotaxis family, CheB/CheR fusion protein